MTEWKIELDPIASFSLKTSLDQGPIHSNGKRLFNEQRVGNIGSIKIEIFSNEHPPPHFRVIYNGESNNFSIKDCSPLNGKALKKYFSNIKEWHSSNKQLLIDTWNNSRPTNCPVGKYIEL